MYSNTTSTNFPPKIHINPKFCNIAGINMQETILVQEERIQPHINPIFLYRQAPKIHMNPNFFPMPPTTTNAFAAINATSYNCRLDTSATTTTTTTTNTLVQPQLVVAEENYSFEKKQATTATAVLADTTTHANRYKLDKRERPIKQPTLMLQTQKTSYKPSLNKKLETLNINGVIYQSTGKKLRSHVNNAKQRSLQVLRQNLVKSNIPCPIFRRLGKCRAFEAKKCKKVHDKKYVIICRKFLKGECDNSGCLLSHDISLNKMPVCRFFLQANCIRDNCPYLHKKLGDDALLCPEFLRGYCPLGDKCTKLHDTEHNTGVNFAERLKAFKLNQKSQAILPVREKKIIKKRKNVRYFLNNNDSDDDADDDVMVIGDGDNEDKKKQQKNSVTLLRPQLFKKLGVLPSFIPI